MRLRGLNVLALTMLCLASVEFVARAPVRAVKSSEWTDFLSPYVQSRAWIHGADPYRDATLLRFWPPGQEIPDFVKLDFANGRLAAKRGMPSPYPLTAFVLLSPIAAIPWVFARSLWLAINLIAFLLMLWLMVSLACADWRDWRTQLFLAFTIALAPFHTGLATANPVILVVALCVAAVWLAQQGRVIASGVTLAVGLSLKPTVAMAFVIFYIVHRQWRMVAAICATTTVLMIVAMARLWRIGFSWLATYLENSAKIFSRGSIDDFTPANRVWFNMVNVQVAFYSLVKSVLWTRVLSLSVVAVFFGLWLWFILKNHAGWNLLALSTLVTICLLPVYHRFYDAALLIFPLAWAWLCARPGQRWRISALVAPFLLPGAALLGQMGIAANLARVPSTSVEWRLLLVSHEAWLLLLLSAALLYEMRFLRPTNSFKEQVSLQLQRSVPREYAN